MHLGVCRAKVHNIALSILLMTLLPTGTDETVSFLLLLVKLVWMLLLLLTRIVRGSWICAVTINRHRRFRQRFYHLRFQNSLRSQISLECGSGPQLG